MQVADSGWSLADGTIDVLLMKENKQNWWKTIMKGDREINTQKARSWLSLCLEQPAVLRAARQSKQAC